MFTKRQVVETATRVAAIGGLSISFVHENWLTVLCFFVATIIFVLIAPWLLTKIRLKKDDFEEVDGEIFLWGGEDDKIEYHLTINDPRTIPFKEFLKIRVNENARDDSIK